MLFLDRFLPPVLLIIAETLLYNGVNTAAKMNTYILESDTLDGDWKLVTYLKDFGEQAYFVNIPSKFISKDGKTAWLLYWAIMPQTGTGKASSKTLREVITEWCSKKLNS